MLRTTLQRLSAYIPRETPAKSSQHVDHPPELTKMGNKMVAASYVKEKVDESINQTQKKRDQVEEKHKIRENMEETSRRHPTGKKIIPSNSKADNHLGGIDQRQKSEAELKNDGTKLYD